MPSLTIPSAPSELEDLLSDRTRVEEVMNAGQFPDLVKAYARNVHQKDPELNAQIHEQVQAGIADFLRENREGDVKRPNLAPGKPGAYDAKGKGAAYNAAALGAHIDGKYDSLGEVLRATSPKASTFGDREALGNKHSAAEKILNSFGSQIPADGGFLIPEQMRSDLLQVSLESSIVRPRATVVPMTGLRLSLPTVDVTSNVSSVFGGIVGYWTEEGAALTESQGAFGKIVLDAKKLTAFCLAPNELVADAPAFSAYIDQKLPQAVSFFEDIAFMTGSAVGEPEGFINSPGVASVSKETGQTAATLLWENITKMYARMLPASLASAVWIASIDVFPELATMALSVGTGGSAVWLNNGVQGPPMTILGCPVIFTEKTPVLGTTGDISFVDLSYYLIGDRQTMQVASSTEYKFGSDQTAFRVIERVDGRPWLQSAITPKNNSSSTLSAFVQLATRS